MIGITGRKDTSARLLGSPLYAVGQTYVRAISHAGGVPIILPPMMQPDDWPILLDKLDGLLLTGGEDIAPELYGQEAGGWVAGTDPERDASEMGLVQLALEREQLPILAICRGHQLLNVALGGNLYQDIAAQLPNTLSHAYVPGRPMEDKVHTVTLEPDSKISHVLQGTRYEVNSAHHQAIKEAGKGLRVVAYAPDGVVEAVEMPNHPFCISVQWHPEAMVPKSEEMWPLFYALVEAAK
ncbi:MAG: gamma-glutamyl-gamma-aminobutyrate hydrolase family protein [Anaerolineae bacterium]|nr:gamma-glutamyl-gamma-aminobutyrate hydrolase family protein [Anaerolineae bacterium]